MEVVGFNSCKRREKKKMEKCVQIGLVSGMRAFAVPGVFAQMQHSSFFGRVTPDLWSACMVLEWIQDQWPDAPNRNDPIPLLFRMLSGATVAVSLNQDKHTNWLSASMLGAGSAYVGTQVSFRIRKYLAEEWKIPQMFLGSLEDVISVWMATRLSLYEKNVRKQ
jgi:uncharacterized membrane protein